MLYVPRNELWNFFWFFLVTFIWEYSPSTHTTPRHANLYDTEEGTGSLACCMYSLFSCPFQGDKFYIELYGGNVVVTKRLDYESINNYTLKIVAKVGGKKKYLKVLFNRVYFNSHIKEYHPWSKKQEHLTQYNKQHHKEVILNSFQLNGHTLGFHPQIKQTVPNESAVQKLSFEWSNTWV